VSFGATGAYSPLPAAVRFLGSILLLDRKMFTIAVALFAERSQLP